MPQPFLPGVLPQLDERTVRFQLESAGIDSTATPALLALRGFYGPNARNVYDDALFLATPLGVQAFNANTDPSRYEGTIARLAIGLWSFKCGTHHPGTPQAYPAFVQAEPFVVERANGIVESGEFYIHLHRGGQYTSTSSLGCQTIPPSQWDRAYSAIARAITASGRPAIPYYLTEFTSP